jgi:proline racemase
VTGEHVGVEGFTGVRGPIRVVDTHTEGMATRVIVDGVGDLPGATIQQRRAHLLARGSDLRTFLMCEPRGHEAMTGALLQTPTRAGADVGVIWMEVEGCIATCGHGAMGVAVALVATGRVEMEEPVTTVRLDTPTGLVVVRVAVRDGRIGPVTIALPPASSIGLDLTVDLPRYGAVRYDLAYGGNHSAITDLSQFGLPFERQRKEAIREAGLALVAAVGADHELRHADGTLAELRHAHLLAPGTNARHSRHAMVIAPGWFDRSPCGTGTAGRLAQLHARGELRLGDELVNESFIGTCFTGRIVGETEAGVLPEITGRAFVTGHTEFVLDPDDPLPAGFLV